MILNTKKYWIIAAINLYCSTASYAETTEKNHEWHFEFAPYLWMSGIHGDITTKGKTTDVDLSFKDIIEHFQGGFQGHLEAGYKRWSLMLDATYLDLNDDFEKQVDEIPFKGNVKQKLDLIDAGVFYRILGSSSAALELLAGARYFESDVTIKFDHIPHKISDDEHSTSPIVGARVTYDFTSKIHTWIRGDIGGFHVDNMNNTWSAIAGLGYTIVDHVDIGIAYRAVKINYENDNSAINTLMRGPMIGVDFYY